MIVHHNPCFYLFILHNNSYNNQGSEINKKGIFLRYDILSCMKTFFLLFSLKTVCRNVKKCRRYMYMEHLLYYHTCAISFSFFFFLLGCSLMDIDNSQDSRAREGTFFIPIYHLDLLTNIQTFISNFAHEMTTTNC